MKSEKTLTKNILDACSKCKRSGKDYSSSITCHNCAQWWKIYSSLVECKYCLNSGKIIVCNQCQGKGMNWQPYEFILRLEDPHNYQIVRAWLYWSPLGNAEMFIGEIGNHYELLYELKKEKTAPMYGLTSFGTGVDKRWEILFDEKKNQPKRRNHNQIKAWPKLKPGKFTWSDAQLKIAQFCGEYTINCNCQAAVKFQWQTFFEGESPVAQLF